MDVDTVHTPSNTKAASTIISNSDARAQLRLALDALAYNKDNQLARVIVDRLIDNHRAEAVRYYKDPSDPRHKSVLEAQIRDKILRIRRLDDMLHFDAYTNIGFVYKEISSNAHVKQTQQNGKAPKQHLGIPKLVRDPNSNTGTQSPVFRSYVTTPEHSISGTPNLSPGQPGYEDSNLPQIPSLSLDSRQPTPQVSPGLAPRAAHSTVNAGSSPEQPPVIVNTEPNIPVTTQ
jgi:hypothetical protein